jgi:hypothetical protein
MRVGILELIRPNGRPDGWHHAPTHWIARQYASIVPQAVSVWCRQLGHETFFATYYGQRDPMALLPADLDVVFIGAYTRAAPLAYALARLYRRAGTLTVLGGPHAKAFPEDALRFFDVVVGECDKRLVAEILRGRPRGVRVSSGRPLTDVPSIEERLPEIRTASFHWGRPTRYSVIGVLGSVGCPYRCDFCTDWNRTYTALPVERLEADLRFVAERFPMVKVAFHDANFAVKFDQVMDAMERVPAESRPGYLIESTLSVIRGQRLGRLHDTRCWYAAAGIESWTEYSNKSARGAAVSGRRKLERMLDHFALLTEEVPIVQANFIFGVDGDRGDEPVELTREFIRRAPSVWPQIAIPTPFRGTPLYERHRREGRILETMPFAFYYQPYLITVPRHYEPADYYDKLARIQGELTTRRSVAARLSVRPRGLGFINALRINGIRGFLGEYRTIAGLLRSDARFRAFHERRSDDLPDFYRERLRDLLGPYAEVLTAEDSVPLLPAAAADEGVPTSGYAAS